MNTNFGKIENGNITYAPDSLVTKEATIFYPSAENYAAHGYYPIIDVHPEPISGKHEIGPTYEMYQHSDPVSVDATRYEIHRVWTLADDEPRVRTFSKLKCYGALVQLGKWAEVKAWLEAENLWDAFLLAQDVKEDNAYFTAGIARFKAQFGMTDEQVEAILAQCEAEV